MAVGEPTEEMFVRDGGRMGFCARRELGVMRNSTLSFGGGLVYNMRGSLRG